MKKRKEKWIGLALLLSLSVTQSVFAAPRGAIGPGEDVGDDIVVEESRDDVDDGHGIRTGQSDNGITTKAGDRLTVNVSGDKAHGAVTYGTNNTIEIGDDFTANVSGFFGHGIAASGSSKQDNRITIGDNATLNISGDQGAGISIDKFNGGNLIKVGNHLTIHTTGENLAHGIGANGYELAGGGNNRIEVGDDLNLTTEGTFSYGISAGGDQNQIQIGNRATIQTKEEGAYGIYNWGNGTKISIGSNLDLTTNGEETHGIFIEKDDGSMTQIGEQAYIKTTGDYSNGVFNQGANSILDFMGKARIETTGDYSHGMVGAKLDGSKTTFHGESAIITQGEGSHAVYIQGDSNSQIIFEEQATIHTDGAGSQAVWVNSADSLVHFKKGAQIDLVDTNKAYALVVQNGGEIRGDAGKYLITGRLASYGNDSKIGIDFDNGSLFTGRTLKKDGGIIDFKMIGGSTWNMDGNSALTTLDFQNNGNEVRFMDANGFSTLTTDSLTGNNGHFFMRTDIEAGEGDLLIAQDTGSHGGIHKITVANDGGVSVDGTERLTIVDTTIGNAKFELTNAVELGGYQYNLRQVPEDMMDWELYAGTKDPAGETDAGVQLFSGAYLLNYAENQTLLKRLGDLRNGKEKENGIWARAYGGKFTSGSDGFLHGFDMNYWGIQTGYDKKIEREDKKGTVYVGGFLGYSKGNLDYLGNGSGSIDSKSLGAYWTHIHRNGFYADAVFKYNWMENDFKNLDSAGKTVKGEEINTRGFSTSFEVGRRYFFDKTDQKGEKIRAQDREGWYVEPQVQLTLGHQNGSHFTTSSGLRIKADSYRSVLGRAEVHLGYEVKTGKNPINVYGKLGVMKEFDGDVDYYLNGTPEETSYGDTWKLWGVGITAQFSQKHNLYLEVEKATGGQFNQEWGINGGYRFQW